MISNNNSMNEFLGASNNSTSILTFSLTLSMIYSKKNMVFLQFVSQDIFKKKL